MSTPLPPAAAPAAPAVPAKPAAPAEDDSEEGKEMATFSEYAPSALPTSVVSSFNGVDNTIVSTTSCNGIDGATGNDNATGIDNATVSTALTVPSHTSSACESALLSSVAAPMCHPDTAACITTLCEQRKLSPLQAEGVMLAIQRHQRVFRNGQRAGFFLGDGAGIGKGRQIAAILRDSLCRKDTTKRHLWLSVSRDLIQDARRDLKDIGVHCDVHDGTELLSSKGAGLGRAPKGIMFLTYNLLISDKRLEQIIEWCADTTLSRRNESLEKAFSGCIIFDESHKAKVCTKSNSG